jgi:GR25 family glycosyltransferase involved in LPS biosynthesis
MPPAKFKAYLIHYTKYSARIESMTKTFRVLGLDFDIITKWDAEEIGDAKTSICLWEERITKIKNILIANTMCDLGTDYTSKLKISSEVIGAFHWMEPRTLRKGEVSVLLKHYNALLDVAYGSKEYGVIFEDDVLTDRYSKSEFNLCMDELIEKKEDTWISLEVPA